MSTVNGKYMMYRGKPLVREGQQLCYGNMSDKYVLVLGIMSTKKVGNQELPDQVMIMIQRTSEDKTVVKSGIKNGLQEAFEYGIIWLETELAK